MENYIELNQILKNTAPVIEHKIINQNIKVMDLSVLKLRDILQRIGKIQKELLEDNVYVAIIPGGFFKKNYAVIAIKLCDNELLVSAYADEGLINQHTCEGAINELRRNIKQFIRE